MQTLRDVAIDASLTYLVRADLNVPLENGVVADDTRLRAAAQTVQHIIDAGASVVLMSHLGRPKGSPNPAMSLAPVAKRLRELFNWNLDFAEDCIGDVAAAARDALKPGNVLLLENLRFHAAEEANDATFAEALSKFGDVFVNDAFATAHRSHASTVGITSFFDTCLAGHTVAREIEYFERALRNPVQPLAAIFGGAKVSSKIAAIQNVANVAETIIIGGAMANTFLAARGIGIGTSLFEEDYVSVAKETETALAEHGRTLLLPVDAVCASAFRADAATEVVPIHAVPEDKMILDIGPESCETFRSALATSKTIVWNGPMGAFEFPSCASGTFAIVDALAESDALTVVGGGDTDRALHDRHALEKMSYVSTAGGAFLVLLEGKKLPAIEALS